MTQEAVEAKQGKNEDIRRPTEKDVVLGDQVIVVRRLRTRDGLAVAHTLLRYINALRDPIAAAFKDRDAQTLTSAESIEVGLGILEAAANVIDEDELLKLLCRLLGQPADLVGDAPLEDTLDAVAAALSINDMPALVRAASAIWQEAQRIGEGS